MVAASATVQVRRLGGPPAVSMVFIHNALRSIHYQLWRSAGAKQAGILAKILANSRFSGHRRFEETLRFRGSEALDA